jgi:gamma-glutamyl-gamma-aminobutyrate hydrolase PuuD
MLVLITQRIYELKKDLLVTGLENDYAFYLEKLGINFILLPLIKNDIKKYLNQFPITHIILTGGNDISPSFYNQEVVFTSGSSMQRDALEYEVLNYAVANKLPVLGICRGMQLLNVYFGGSLIQSISHFFNSEQHLPNKRHYVKLIEENIVKEFAENEIEVNSYHNQAVLDTSLANDLCIFAIDKQLNIVEGLKHKSLPIAGIQWHPEREKESKKIDDFLMVNFINKKLFWKV